MIPEIKAVVPIVVAIAGGVALIHRMLLQSMANEMKQFELFLKLQKLCGSDARHNLAAMRVALACFTKRNLTKTEIEWFLLVPGAFSFMGAYGKLSSYVTVDFENNKFIFKSEFDSKKKRLFEWSKLAGLYVIFGTLGILLILIVPITLKTGELNPWVGFHVAGYVFCLLAITFLLMCMKIHDAKRLTREKITG